MDTSPQGVLTEEGSQQSASEGSASWGTRCRDGFAGARLRVMRAAAGRTIASVAADAGLSVPYIANLEDGQGNPTLAALDRLARALGTELTVGLGAPSPQAPVGPSASLVRVARTERFRRIATEFAGPDRSSAEIAAALVDLACARRPDPRHRAHRGRLVASARRIAARRPASDRRLISPELSAAVSLIRSLRLPGSGRVRQGGRGPGRCRRCSARSTPRLATGLRIRQVGPNNTAARRPGLLVGVQVSALPSDRFTWTGQESCEVRAKIAGLATGSRLGCGGLLTWPAR